MVKKKSAKKSSVKKSYSKKSVKKPVRRTAPDSNLYKDTNSSLLQILEKSIAQEKREISLLSRQEKSLKSKLVSEEKQIKKQNLPEQKRSLKRKIVQMKKDLAATKSNIQKKERLKKHSLETLKKLKEEIASDKLLQEKNDALLAKKLKSLSELKKQESNEAQLRIKDINRNLSSLNKDHRALVKHYHAVLAATRRGVFNEGDVLFGSILSRGLLASTKSKTQVANLKKSTVSGQQKLEKQLSLLQAKIEKLVSKQFDIAQKIYKQERALADLDQLEDERAQISKFVEEQQQRLNGLQKILTHWASKKSELKKLVSDQKVSISQKRKFKELVLASYKKELQEVSRSYNRKLSENLATTKSIKQKISSVQKKKKSVVGMLETDNKNLAKTHAQIYMLADRLDSREKTDSYSVKILTQAIKEQKRQFLAGKQKIENINLLLDRVKKMSMSSPEVIRSFKKEQAVVKNHLNQIQKQIASKKHQVNQITSVLDSYKKNLNRKILSVKKSEQLVIQEKKGHQGLLRKLDSELTDLQHELISSSSKVSSTEAKKSRALASKRMQVSKKISEINNLIKRKSSEHEKSIHEAAVVVKQISKLTTSSNKVMKNLLKTKDVLSRYDLNISLEKNREAALASEQILLQQLVEKIQKEESNRDLLKKDLVGSSSYLSKRKSTLANQLSNYISKLQSVLAKKEQRESDLIKQKIKKQRSEKSKVYSKLQKEHSQVIQDIVSEKKKHQIKQKNLISLLSELHRKSKLAALAEKNSRKHLRDYAKKSNLIRERISSSELKRQHIEGKLQQRDAHSKQLVDLVNQKIQRLREKNLLQKEAVQIRAVINNRLGLQKKVVASESKKARVTKKDLKKHLERMNVRDKKEMKDFLKKMDDLLGKLPALEVKKFSKSSDFKKYKSVLKRYGVN